MSIYNFSRQKFQKLQPRYLTSTAYIAKEMKVPSIYYDSSSLVSKNAAACGVEIINSRDELDSFLQSLI